LKTRQLASFKLDRPEEMALKERIVSNLKEAPLTYDQFIQEEPVIAAAVIDKPFPEARKYQMALLSTPNDANHLGKLKHYFEEKNMLRLSAYYSDRIESLKN